MRDLQGKKLKIDHQGAIGLGRGDNYILNFSFDILSLEALFLVPRYGLLHHWCA